MTRLCEVLGIWALKWDMSHVKRPLQGRGPDGNTWVGPLGVRGTDVAALIGDLQAGVLLVQLALGVVVDGEVELPHAWKAEGGNIMDGARVQRFPNPLLLRHRSISNSTFSQTFKGSRYQATPTGARCHPPSNLSFQGDLINSLPQEQLTLGAKQRLRYKCLQI